MHSRPETARNGQYSFVGSVIAAGNEQIMRDEEERRVALIAVFCVSSLIGAPLPSQISSKYGFSVR